VTVAKAKIFNTESHLIMLSKLGGGERGLAMVTWTETGDADLKPRILMPDTSSACLLNTLLNPNS